MREVTASGQTVDEAVQTALEQLETTKDQIDVEVIDEGKKGLLGVFGSKRAVVKAVKLIDPIEEAEHFIGRVTEKMDVPVKIDTSVDENHITFTLNGDKIALLIGKRGQTLNALQYLVQLVMNKSGSEFYSVMLDAEGYRSRRKETLESLALKMADKAQHIQDKVALEPMPAFERKIIHTALQEENTVQTYSAGNDPHRHIVIKPA